MLGVAKSVGDIMNTTIDLFLKHVTFKIRKPEMW